MSDIGDADSGDDGAADALAVQLEDLQERLLRDADTAGVPHADVLDAIERSIAACRDATVTSFVPVLIEHEIRAALSRQR